MTKTQRNRYDEVFGVLLLMTTVFLAAALLSYNSSDPSYNTAAPEVQPHNLIGRVGSHLSDVLFQVLGFVAFLLPLPFLLAGIKKIRARPIEDLFLKTLGFIAVASSLCAGLSLFELPISSRTNFSPGGLLGTLLAGPLLTYLNRTGSILLLTTVFILAILAITRFSLRGFSALVKKFLAVLFRPFRPLKVKYDEKRKLRKLKKRREMLRLKEIPDDKPFHETEYLFADKAEAVLYGNGDGALSGKTISPGRARKQSFDSVPPVSKPIQTAFEWDDKEKRKAKNSEYRLPPLSFLKAPSDEIEYDIDELREKAHTLAEKCAEFKVTGEVKHIHPGPVVTTFEFKPDPGVKYTKILALSDDLCLAMKAEAIRIDRIAGKSTVGIEVPNTNRRMILLREVLSSRYFNESDSDLTLALGLDIKGGTVVTNLLKMPHLLIAGSTGTGKSVGLNCMVCSILYKASPENVRFIMVDPKRLELGPYEHIPHLLTPIVTDPKKAANALHWAVKEMENRYRLLALQGVRNLDQYNVLAVDLARDKKGRDDSEGETEEFQKLPKIVIVVDELADLMMTSGKDVEASITRLAQMARAVGIHLILATQRPSVDVITGLIKANFPSRISFRVSSKIDSRTILDANGAEQLLGMGDMLFLSPSHARLSRIHGAYISEKEISKIVSFLKEQAQPEYHEEILVGDDSAEDMEGERSKSDDPLYDEVARFVVEQRKASTSLLQRRFGVGYGRAAKLMDSLEYEGIIGPMEGPSKPRSILVSPDYFSEIDNRDPF
ncbi:MAG: DNA translocase FtsK 4TM domain-containing protein [Acidobacteriota bacterium]